MILYPGFNIIIIPKKPKNADKTFILLDFSFRTKMDPKIISIGVIKDIAVTSDKATNLIAKKKEVKAQIFKKALTKCKYLYLEINTVLSFKNKGTIKIKPKRLL